MSETRAYQSVDENFDPLNTGRAQNLRFQIDQLQAQADAIEAEERPRQPAIRQATAAPVDQTWMERKRANLNPASRLETKHVEVKLLPRWELAKTVRNTTAIASVCGVAILLTGMHVQANVDKAKAAQTTATVPASAVGNSPAPKP